MVTCPCKGCTNRHSGCHSTCVEYNEWALQIKHEHEMNRKTMPDVICKSDFVGTSKKRVRSNSWKRH